MCVARRECVPSAYVVLRGHAPSAIDPAVVERVPRTDMLIFVYGTLRRGEPNHGELRHARFVSHAATLPKYELVDMGAYPALVEGGKTAVQGELYEVEDALLAHLDIFEDVPTLYERKPIAIRNGQAMAYVMRHEQTRRAARIATGDWRARHLEAHA
jgi:gamma-glutamylcyclotransferase (GGCT)/AIG2-like uncharacterized protein YtfP